jgi:hypothetical protein
MRIVKVKSEAEKSYEIVKEFQSNSDINAQLGKKVYELELSKRNEEVVNKKYDQIIEELRLIQAENINLCTETEEKEK